ncbi:flavodoxin domain-containing protein [Salisediminibacterium selenitireducens]|uniref:Flavodoxin-like protein n=1 Tax=Bacillus selenitireducens (strain ATCC 700615 / DSM 15326 / MLS10) TaxID=439292 RepID=D6XUE5_BACIE|nr:flavodoxin domain-containing protein [Salisediminibacterium selenitireducens]ADH99431.1 Flavodoxin-like protein [[Bacillus] selenitireducens MLS10]
MKTAVIYCSKHGTAHKTAVYISNAIPDSELIELSTSKKTDFRHYDRVILGASVHMGQINRRMKALIQHHESLLLEKRIGLFLCCMHEDMEAQLQFENAFPESLREHASAIVLPGGELIFSKMNMFEKMIVRRVTGSGDDQSTLNYQALDTFIQAMKSEAYQR